MEKSLLIQSQVGSLIQTSWDVLHPVREIKHFHVLFFWICVPDSRFLQPTLESVMGSAPVEQPINTSIHILRINNSSSSFIVAYKHMKLDTFQRNGIPYFITLLGVGYKSATHFFALVPCEKYFLFAIGNNLIMATIWHPYDKHLTHIISNVTVYTLEPLLAGFTPVSA